ncbi:MAG: hypothetical protein AAB974_02270 [Patescibacteria group bacterium]
MDTPQILTDPDFDSPTASLPRSGNAAQPGMGLREALALIRPQSAFAAGVVSSVFLAATVGFIVLLPFAARLLSAR